MATTYSYAQNNLYPFKIYYFPQEIYNQLIDKRTITINGNVINFDENALYLTDVDMNQWADTKVTTRENTTSRNLYVTGCEGSMTGPLGYNTNVYIDCAENVLYGAAWNDYAEFRIADSTEAGRVICENGDDTLSLAKERMQPGAAIISDTFGFAIGETEKAKTPIAVSGRVLAYPYEDRESFAPGDAVCAAPGGTVSKMTREEIREYPERIVGTVSAIPNYDVWGEKQVHVDGRIWIKVR